VTDAEIWRLLAEQGGALAPVAAICWVVWNSLKKMCASFEAAVAAALRRPLVVRVVHVIESDNGEVVAKVRELLRGHGIDVDDDPTADVPRVVGRGH
jgi:uncharacterized membrane protein